MSHPLVGKKIVDGCPGRGEVTRKLIQDTFVNVDFIGENSLVLQVKQGGRLWVIHHDTNMIITSVTRD